MPGNVALSEDDIQSAIVDWLRIVLPNDALVHHSPNEGVRSSAKGGRMDGARRKAMGTLKGWPDLEIVTGGRVYFLEVKTAKGSTDSDQKTILGVLADQGLPVAVVRSVDDTRAMLDVWGVETREVRAANTISAGG